MKRPDWINTIFVGSLFAILATGWYASMKVKTPTSPTIERIEKEIDISGILEDEDGEPLILNESDIGCLSVALFHEARGESHLGQIAVANVIMNRVRVAAHPDSICEVVYYKCHFSFACDKRKQYDPANLKNELERRAWASAQQIAREAIIAYNSIDFHDITGGATYYHTKKVKPKWSKARIKTIEIGNHIFYKT